MLSNQAGDAKRTSLHGHWSSRMAFILAVTGSAVGLGNIWKFPYIAGQNGGGAFVLVYLICVVVIGMPVMMSEILIGRRGRRNPVATMELLGKEEGSSPRWKWVGGMGVVAGIFILSYYSVIAGWTLAYIVKSATGVFAGATAEAVGAEFASFVGDWRKVGLTHTLFMGLTIFVVARGVSMDGDIAEVPALVNACRKHDAWLMLDDAHGFGVLGDNGRGTLEHYSVSTADAPIYMATLGKAVGTAGAFIAGSDALIETLIQQARPYIYTTASPPAVAEAARASLNMIKSQPDLRDRLNHNIRYFRSCCEQMDIELTNSQTAIQPVIIGDTKTTLELSEQLLTQGLLITAIRPPTVPEGTARLRITISAAHSHTHIDKLISTLDVVHQ